MKNQNDTELLEMHKIISKQMSILYQISSDHIETPPYRLPPKNNNDFTNKMTTYNLSVDEINLLSKINTLPKILRLQGLFAFFLKK